MTNSSRCKKNEEAENVVVTDLESDSLYNVYINIPKSCAKKPQRSNRSKSDERFPPKTYIYIDDDDDNHHSRTEYSRSSQKNPSPVKLSKNKRTYPGRGPATTYGFNMQSDGDSFDDSKKVIHEKETQCADPTVDDALVESSIVRDREKLKDTDGCKLAQEEELSARQTTLKVQAEEAQKMRRLLKRKKAEKLRLLNMQRRQKRRVEEIRESQKMDEEYMNLKEIYRTEVQKDLKKLEMKCHNMASLLHSLGILIHYSPYTSSHQVHAAYKRALLTFHPDRASGSDMRKQVEAEEKFKLISRMKDKVRNTPRLK